MYMNIYKKERKGNWFELHLMLFCNKKLVCKLRSNIFISSFYIVIILLLIKYIKVFAIWVDFNHPYLSIIYIKGQTNFIGNKI